MEDTTIEDVLKTVQTYYAQKDYESALRTLQENQSSISSGVWHYNLGTIYGKMENWALARYHLLMAEKEGHTTKEALLNKEFVESKLEIGKLEQPLSTTDYLIKGSLEARHGVYTLVGLILVIIGIFSMWKKASYKVWGSLFGVALIIFSLNWWVESLDQRIVLQSQAIQDGPSAIFETTDELPEGIMVITSQKGNWLKIIYPTRFEGWIKDKGLKELK